MDICFVFHGEKLQTQNKNITVFTICVCALNQNLVGFLIMTMLMESTTSLTDKLPYISKAYHLQMPQFSLAMFQFQVVQHRNKHFARPNNLEEKNPNTVLQC